MNQPIRHRPLSIGPLRAFEAVARTLSFRKAAEELSLTQSAISRQIRALEEEIGCTLFLRGTRHVELTADGAALQSTTITVMEKLDQTVRQIRRARGRRVVTVTTFPSFASLWLIPRLEAFQRDFPDIDIRVSASDVIVELDDSEIDLALRYTTPANASPHAVHLFGETLTPVACSSLMRMAAEGRGPALSMPADLAQYTLAEEDDMRSGEVLSWRRWLRENGAAGLQPRRWMYLNFTYQQVQAAMSGQALALARVAMVSEQLQRGDLIEPFGMDARMSSPYSYWLLQAKHSSHRPEVQQFSEWILAQAAQTRIDIGETETASTRAVMEK
jgi:LysR family glycine cleavage system transcriptional activator